MKSPPALSGPQLRTYERIFQHPISHNLGWHDVLAMFRQLGEVGVEANGTMKVTRNGQFIVLRPRPTKDVAEAEEVMALRHFLERTETTTPEAKGAGTDWLVVIDHHQARLFRSVMQGGVPQQILPHEPGRYTRHEHHSRDFSRGKERPDPNNFFEPVAQALAGAGRILVFGTGTGMSSEMDQFTAWIKQHHPELSGRIAGSMVVDENHLIEGQLLGKAREFYAKAQPSSA
jgi:hypothetical protein